MTELGQKASPTGGNSLSKSSSLAIDLILTAQFRTSVDRRDALRHSIARVNVWHRRERVMRTRWVQAIIAGALVAASLVLFDYCRYVIAHHPNYDLARLFSLGIQGAIASVYFLGMFRLVDTLTKKGESAR